MSFLFFCWGFHLLLFFCFTRAFFLFILLLGFLPLLTFLTHPSLLPFYSFARVSPSSYFLDSPEPSSFFFFCSGFSLFLLSCFTRAFFLFILLLGFLPLLTFLLHPSLLPFFSFARVSPSSYFLDSPELSSFLFFCSGFLFHNV